jgi:hypothetical protein
MKCEFCKRVVKRVSMNQKYCNQCSKERKREYEQRPEVKERAREYEQRPEVKERKREYQQRPEVKERAREYYQRPEVKERKREYDKKYYYKHRGVDKRWEKIIMKIGLEKN